MKKIIISLFFVISCNFSFSQEAKNQKIEPIGDLLEVTIYYDDGAIMQHGFMTKDHKLHASWKAITLMATEKVSLFMTMEKK